VEFDAGMAEALTDAVAYYSKVARAFHNSYSDDANRLERLQIWGRFFDRFAENARFGYDLGCGSGILACELTRRGLEIVGIDGAPNMLAIAEETARKQRLNGLSFQKHILPIANPETFRRADIIISSSALEYLPSMPKALQSIHAMLRPGGSLLFSVSNQDSLSRRAVRFVHSLTGRPAYVGLLKQFMTAEEIKRDLRDAGFTYLYHEYFAKADRINRLLRRFAPERFSSNMIIVAARRD
jgi:2-polyprenyl-3-methyl-5-hydroxy-6-metoxy-1,4-benzoquinol methylase